MPSVQTPPWSNGMPKVTPLRWGLPSPAAADCLSFPGTWQGQNWAALKSLICKSTHANYIQYTVCFSSDWPGRFNTFLERKIEAAGVMLPGPLPSAKMLWQVAVDAFQMFQSPGLQSGGCRPKLFSWSLQHAPNMYNGVTLHAVTLS